MELKRNILFFSTVLVVIFVYSNIIPLKDTSFCTVILPKDSFTMIGTISSDPVKINRSKPLYKAYFSPEALFTPDGETSSCSGNILLYFPSELVEAHYPGKLRTSWRKKGLCITEKNEKMLIKVKNSPFGNKEFNVLSAKNLQREQSIFSWIASIRTLCRLHFKRLMYSWGKAGGLFLALITGSREYLDANLSLSFRNAGLSHILALSGMHLSLLSGLALLIGKLSGSTKKAYVFQALVIIIFVWFAGLSPSLLRALIFSLILLTSKLFNLKIKNTLSVLCLTFLIHISVKPQDAHEISFILSYTALLSIILFTEYFAFWFIKFLPFSVSSSLSTSTAAQIFTMPVSLKTFGTFTPGGIISTLFISPLITVFIYLGLFLTIVTLIFPIIAVYSSFLINCVYFVIEKFVILFSKIPFIQIN